MSYTLTDYSATEVELNDGIRSYYYKKCYCSVELQGEYIVFTSHKVENNAFRQQWSIAYTDFTSPTGTASAVYNAIKTIIENYAASTTGGGIKQGVASGTDTYTTSITGVTSYTDGDVYLIRFTNGNTTGCNLNINSIGSVPLYRNNDGALIGGDIQDGAEMLVVYNSSVPCFQCIGTSPNSIISYVTNADSVTITKGMPVYAFSGTGDRMTVKRALNTGDSTSAQTVGLVLSSSIGANQKGLIMMQGLLDGLSILKPADGWADGDAVYLGSTAGTLTKTKPYAPNHLVYLGFVTTSSPGAAGRMYVRVQNGYELDELHNVQAQSPSNKDTIYYDSASSQWKTASLTTILGYTPATSARTISTTTPLSGGGDLSADRTLSIADAVADGTTKGAATFTASDFNSASGVISLDYTNGQAASASNKGFLTSADWSTFNGKQTALVSGTNIKTVNSTSLLGSGDVAVQATLVSGTNIKTVNSTSLLGSGNVAVGTVTSVGALTLGTTGTDLSSTVANGTTTPAITLNVPTASATNRGALSSADWSTFNGKQNALTLTTTGTSGAATLVGSTLNIPQYSGGGSSSTKSAWLTTVQALGSGIRSESICFPHPSTLATTTGLTSQLLTFWAVYVPEATTITGVMYWITNGNSVSTTTTGFNGFGLYTLSGSTLTRVAVTADAVANWRAGSANSVQKIPFNATYSASAGLYYIGMLACITGTLPSIRSMATNNQASTWGTMDFPSNFTCFQVSAQTTMPTSQAMGIQLPITVYGSYLY